MHTFRRLLRGPLCVALLALGCTEEDSTPPAPPLLSQVVSPTSLDTQTVRGTAEFGASVAITGAELFLPGDILVDPYTAKWEAVVKLASGENVLKVVAKDAAGNVSQEASATIVREDVHAESLAITLSRSLLSSDDAAITVHIHGGNDEPVDMTGLTYSVDAKNAAGTALLPTVMATSDKAGRADAALVGLTQAGLGVIVVTATQSDGLEARADFLVETGLPSALALTLKNAGVDVAGPVPAGTELSAVMVVEDKAKNPIAGAPVSLVTNAPLALVAGNLITITRAGTWDVIGVVSSAQVTQKVKVTVEPLNTGALTLSPSSATVQAGEAIAFTVTDTFGNAVANVDLSSAAPNQIFDAANRAFTFKTTTAAQAPYVVEATVFQVVKGQADITVLPAAAANIDLKTVPSPATVAAGTDVTFTTTVFDEFLNVTTDFVQVDTNAPGAIVGKDTISGLSRAGGFTIVAKVPGTNAVKSAELNVNADSTKTAITLFLTSHGTQVGLPVGYQWTAVDGFGNPVAGTPTLSSSTDTAEIVDPVAQTIVFSTPANHKVEAELFGAQDSDFVVVTNFDVAAPGPVKITSPAADAAFAPGDTITVLVSATDDVALAEVVLQASGVVSDFQVHVAPGGIKTVNDTFTIAIPGGNRAGTVDLIAQAVDTSGNRTSSAPVRVSVDLARTITTVGGFKLTTLAVGDKLNAPLGLAIKGSTLYVANSGANNILMLDSATGAVTQEGVALTVAPGDLVYFAAKDRLFASASNDSLLRIDGTTLAAVDFIDPGAFGRPRGVLIDGTDLWFVDDGDRMRRFDANTNSTQLTSASCTINLGGQNAFPGLGGGGQGIAALGTDFVVTDSGRDAVWRFPKTCPATPEATRLARRTGATPTVPVENPRDVVVAASGLVYFVNRAGTNGRNLVRLDPKDCPGSDCTTTILASGFNAPVGLVFDAAENLYISDEGNDIIYKMTGTF